MPICVAMQMCVGMLAEARAGVTGSCESPDLGIGNQTWLLSAREHMHT